MSFTFSDIYCGVGGFSFVLESLGGECVCAYDSDIQASKLYAFNNKREATNSPTIPLLPHHNILCSTLDRDSFLSIIPVIKQSNPDFVLIETAKSILTHNKRETFREFQSQLSGYSFYYSVLRAEDYGLPQHKRRLYIVGSSSPISFKFPNKIELKKHIEDILEEDPDERLYLSSKIKPFKMRLDIEKPVNKVVRLSQSRYRVYSTKGIGVSLSPNAGGTGAKTGLYYVGERIRQLSPLEAQRLMGFPDSFHLPVSINQAQKYIAQSPVIGVWEKIMVNLLPFLDSGEMG